jgi:hypothetical protein
MNGRVPIEPDGKETASTRFVCLNGRRSECNQGITQSGKNRTSGFARGVTGNLHSCCKAVVFFLILMQKEEDDENI